MTKKQRYDFYKKMLETLDGKPEYYFPGFCYLIWHITHTSSLFSNLPELKSKMPKHSKYTPHKFKPHDWTKRRKILLKCIDETKVE